MVEGLAGKGYRVLGNRMASLTVSRRHRLVAPAVEVTYEAGGGSNADVLAFDDLPMTTRTVQYFSTRMFAEMLVMPEPDLAHE